MQQGFTCGYSQGKAEGGSNWLAEAELGCRAGGAAQEGTSRSRNCTEVEDLGSGEKQITNNKCLYSKPADFNGAAVPSSGGTEKMHHLEGQL